MKNAYYFSHDSNAHDDPKILDLLSEHDWFGYGVFWGLVERMFNECSTSIEHKRIKGLARSMSIDCIKLNSIIEYCINIGLFESDGEFFWSNSLRNRKEKFDNMREQRSKAGKKSAEMRKNLTTVEQPLNENSTLVEQSKGKESKINKRKENNNKNTYAQQVERLWSLYPKKLGKAAAIKQIPRLIEKYGEDKIEKAILRYCDYVSGKDQQYIKNGSTFFNSGYLDYIDEVEDKPRYKEIVVEDERTGEQKIVKVAI